MGLIKTLLIILGLIVVVGLVWGFIGGNQAGDVGTTCDSGLGESDVLCWKWHKNIIGEFGEGLTALGNVIQENLQKLN